MEKKMMDYLKTILKEYIEDKSEYGIANEFVHEEGIRLRACRDMCEELLGIKINLVELAKEITK